MSYYTDQEHLTEITEDQYQRIVDYTQQNPQTRFRIICFCGHTGSGTRLMLWRGPEHYASFFSLC